MSRKQIIILVVEAGETRLSTRKLVLEAAGFNVINAPTAVEALDLFKANSVNAVLLDLDVYDIAPAKFVSEVKESNPQVPVYLLSRDAWVPDELRGQAAGSMEKMSDPQKMVETFKKLFPENGKKKPRNN